MSRKLTHENEKKPNLYLTFDKINTTNCLI